METIQPIRPYLELGHVSLRLDERLILNDVNLAVEPGDYVGVIGPNGAGKTTLLRLILGLLQPTAGTVRILGAPARRGNSGIGYVPQRLTLDPDLPLRGRDFVALGFDGHKWGLPLHNRERRLRVDHALEAVSGIDFADAPIGHLSGGQQQRLLIAQALAGNPRILLLDEPLSNLDIRSAQEVVALTERLARDLSVAVLMVAHDVNPLLHVMTQVLYLANGRSATGAPQTIISSDVLSRLYGYPVEVLTIKGRLFVIAGDTVLDTEGPCIEGGCHEPAGSTRALSRAATL